jgi:hypothetical protein
LTTYMRLGRQVTSPRIYRREPIRTRLLRRVVVDTQGPRPVDNSPCWIWQGSGCHGYGNMGSGGRAGQNGHTVPTHRVAYELWFGPIPAGLDIDHLCRNHACCNPAHLEAVTRSVNLRRGRHGGGRPVGYRAGPETREKLRQAALRREAAKRAIVPWSAEVLP